MKLDRWAVATLYFDPSMQVTDYYVSCFEGTKSLGGDTFGSNGIEDLGDVMRQVRHELAQKYVEAGWWF